MAKQVPGIAGVLDRYVTGGEPDDTPAATTAGLRPEKPPVADRKKSPRPADTPLRARLGRPAGKPPGTVPPKEKATVRVSAELMADYRAWSWEQRCQLGELIEQALVEYRRRFRDKSTRPGSPKV